MTTRSASIGQEPPSRHAVSNETVARLKNGDISVLIPVDENIKAVPKVLAVDPKKCNGCRLCETACSLFHNGETDSALSRIRVIEWDMKDVFLPVLCQHCADAPCRKACPKDAISWEDGWGRVVIDYNRCVSCRMCEAACPYGAVRFDNAREIVFKCDLCDGSPQCVNFCEPGALTFSYADRIQAQRIRKAACMIRRY
jgi:anaerobic carbon-monoxide dehydrogenase iron sulfur subunit